MYNILVCDDEKDIVSALTIYLTTGGYQVFPAYDGTEALAILAKEDIHLVLLDIMMPKLDGIATMTKLREVSNVPVILLTAKSEDTDKILGLNVGADDYVTKPFNPVEVLARVKSQLRRYLQLGGGVVKPTLLQAGGIALDDRTKSVTLDGEPVSLTPREYEILRLLLQHPGTVFSPKRIYRTVWGRSPTGWRMPWPSTSATSGKSWRSTPRTPATSRWSGARGTNWKEGNHETPFCPFGKTQSPGSCLGGVRGGAGLLRGLRAAGEVAQRPGRVPSQCGRKCVERHSG